MLSTIATMVWANSMRLSVYTGGGISATSHGAS